MSEISKVNSLRPQIAAPSADEKSKVMDDKLREVSELYEKHFIREMMKQMRATVHEGGFIKQNNAEKIFRDQMDDQYADQWGKAGGIGLSGMIYEQLIQKFGEKMGIKSPIEKPHGPIELNSKSNFSGFSASSFEGKKAGEPVTLEFKTPPDQKSEVKSPWAGTLLDKKYLEMDQIQYRVKHDNGLESLISTRGTGLGPDSQLSLGDKIESGQSLGWASAASPLFWTIKTNVSE